MSHVSQSIGGNRVVRSILQVLAFAVLAGPLVAQDAPKADSVAPARLRGVVVSADTGAALPHADAVLVGLDQIVTTDASGRFDFGPLAPDTYIVQVRRVGFQPHTVKAQLAPGSTLELTVRLQRVPAVQVLPEVVSEAPAVRGGFYERMKRGGMGAYISREEIESRRPLVLTDLLQSVNGMRVTCGGNFGQCQVLNTRSSCKPAFYMNGARVDISMLENANVQPADVEGIEVYRSSGETPAEYSAATNCGAIVLWTIMPWKRDDKKKK